MPSLEPLCQGQGEAKGDPIRIVADWKPAEGQSLFLQLTNYRDLLLTDEGDLSVRRVPRNEVARPKNIRNVRSTLLDNHCNCRFAEAEQVSHSVDKTTIRRILMRQSDATAIDR